MVFVGPDNARQSCLDGTLWRIERGRGNREAPELLPFPDLKQPQPDFASRYNLEKELGPVYEVISQAALFLAYADMSREASDNGSESS